MALLQARVAALLLLSLHPFSAFAAILQTDLINLSSISSSNATSLPIMNISANDDEYDDCFNPATPHRGLHPAEERDCLDAAEQLLNIRNPFISVMFARRGPVGFKLPQVLRKNTCVISIDVMNDDDRDYFKPILAFNTAIGIAHRCTQGTFRLGGRSTTGPEKVVDVLVFGRIWPPGYWVDEPTPSVNSVVVARQLVASGGSDPPNKTSPDLIKLLETNNISLDKSLGLNDPELGESFLECYDPPLPRERAWPFTFQDCEIAAEAIFGDKQHNQKYTFSRDPVITKFYYPLPARFEHKSCVILLDMKNDGDQDTVRLSIVEATAYVLAHKCSGEEKPMDKYGGRATVGVAAKNLINIWVYGKIWPEPLGTTNVTSISNSALTLDR